MIMVKVILLLLIVLPYGKLWAQQQTNYALAEKFREFALGGPMSKYSLSVFPKFINDTDCFWFDFYTEEGRRYYWVNPDKRRKEELFDREKMACALSEYTRSVVDGKNLSVSGLEFSANQESFTFSFRNREYEYNRKSETLRQLPEHPLAGDEEVVYSYMKWSPDRRYVLYAKDHNLYIRGNKAMGMDTTEIRLTKDGERYYSYAIDDEAEGNGKPVSANALWSNDSRHIYLIRGDTRKVKDMYIVNALDKRPSLQTYRYEMPGDKEVCQYELWIVDIETGKVLKAKADKWPDQYIAILQVSEKGDRIYFERTKRSWEEVDVCVADTETGEVKELIHEKDLPYRDVHMKKTVILNDGADILFRSERTGWGHYYHYDGEGRLKNVITSGAWVAGQIVSIDTLKRTFWFYGHGREKGTDPYYYLLYKASFDREGVTLLSGEKAQHSVNFSPSRKFYIDEYSRVDMQPQIWLKNASGKNILELARPDLRRIKEEGWQAPERFQVKAADGVTDLYGIMWKPADFDPGRKYPVISSVYPGPYYEYVKTSFTLNDGYNTRLAQLGFIVVAVGHRGGSPMRGKAYHRYGYGNMRDYPLADDKCAIEQLAARYPFIDISKVGIYGHSGGGFMAAAALCTYPDFYTAAVASSGNHDNRIYNRGWMEIYHGRPDRITTNLELAGKLKGHLLLVSGDQDRNVHPAHLFRFADALIKAGKNFEMVLLPGAKHGYTGMNDRFFERKMWYHFARYLLGDITAGSCAGME